MSLRFVFEGSKKIKIIRRNRISFRLSNPSVTFTMKNPKKQIKPIQSNTSTVQPTLILLYEKLNTLNISGKYSSLFKFSQPDMTNEEFIEQAIQFFKTKIDLSIIQNKIALGLYKSVSECQTELYSFLDFIRNIPSDMMIKDAKKCEKIFQLAFFTVNEGKKGTVQSKLLNSLNSFIQIQTKKEIIRSQLNLDIIAQKLNQLDRNEQLRAEFLIRTYSPKISYYMGSIDLSILPIHVLEILKIKVLDKFS